VAGNGDNEEGWVSSSLLGCALVQATIPNCTSHDQLKRLGRKMIAFTAKYRTNHFHFPLLIVDNSKSQKVHFLHFFVYNIPIVCFFLAPFAIKAVRSAVIKVY
jgi:hypothetical protein